MRDASRFCARWLGLLGRCARRIAQFPVARHSHYHLAMLILFLLLLLVTIFGPQLWVKRTLKKYHQPPDRYRGSGAELARLLLDAENLAHVSVERTDGGDHYDPIEKAVRLSAECFDARSLTAITVAAHEVGHALQDRDSDPRLSVRTSLAVVMAKLQPLNAGFLLIGSLLATVLGSPRLVALIVMVALAIQILSTVLNLVTLPLEWNASFGRALPMLEAHDILIDGDQHHARRILMAAALTYVAASLISLLFLLRWVR
jgi:uncharacterized protein